MLETLKLFGVKAKDREACLQDLASAFHSYRMRMRRMEEERREIEESLRHNDKDLARRAQDSE